MEWWGRMMVPVRNGWIKLATRLGYHKTGVLKLHHDVRTCEYEDVHVLWDMLQKNEKELVIKNSPLEGGDDSSSSSSGRKGQFWNIVDWAKRAQSFCNHDIIATHTSLRSSATEESEIIEAVVNT